LSTSSITKDIIKLGGVGVTFVNISNSITSVVYFEENKGYEKDSDNIFNVF